MQNDIAIQNSSGNVFADIGASNPEEKLQKAELTRQIIKALEAASLTSEQACQILEIDRKRLSDLKIGKLANFSISELADFVSRLSDQID